MNRIYLLLGSNIGDRVQMLDKATKFIGREMGVIVEKSSIYESEPWGFEANDNFLNQVVLVESELQPDSVLQKIKEIEKEMGRVRSKTREYTSRKIDIDILFYNEIVYHTKDLTIPHPMLQERRFTLLPLKEIAPEMPHPQNKKSMNQLLKECPDQTVVRKIDQVS